MTTDNATPRSFWIVFDGPPSHESGRFVEVEDVYGRSLSVRNWRERKDGYWTLGPFVEPDAYRALVEAARDALDTMRAVVDQKALTCVLHIPDGGDALRQALHDSIAKTREALAAVEAAEKGE